MRAVVFDLDGTLVESAPDLHLVLGEVLAPLGLDAPPLADLRAMVGNGARVLIERALAAADAQGADVEALYARFLAIYTAAPCRASLPFPGAVACLERLAARGIALGLCTNKPLAPTLGLTDALGLTGHFGSIHGGDSLPARKPDPIHLGTVVRELGSTPAHAVMVGDSRTDLEAARALGMPCVLVSFGYTQVPAAALGADAVIDRFDQLDRALERLAAAA